MKFKRALFPLRFLISATLIYLLYRRVEVGQLLEVFRTLRPGPLLLVFVLLFFNTANSALKWKLLLRTDGIDIRWPALTASYLVGSFFNMFLPSNIGGDAYRVYDVARQSRRTAHSFASVLGDRISGYLALVLIAAVFGLAWPGLLPNPVIIWVPVIGLAGLLLVAGGLIQQRFLRRLLDRPGISRLKGICSFTSQLLDSVNRYRAAPALFLRVMSISFVFQITVIVVIYLLARGLDFDIPFHYFCVFVPFVSIVESLPISIFGLGIRDASYAYFFIHAGLGEVPALTLALTYVIVTLVYVSSGGVIFLLRPRGREPIPAPG